jgi:hypothetical protein
VSPDPTILDRIRDVLLNEWDPSNVARSEFARGEYDSYLQPIADLIHHSASEEQVIDFLHQRELESMCFPGLDKTRLRRVARLLLKLKEV